MTLIHIKKIRRGTGNDTTPQDGYAVPCVAIATPAGPRLIPNPSGTEAQVFATLEEAGDAIRRAGFDYVFEGRTTHLLASGTPEGGTGGRQAAVSGRPLEDAVPVLIQLLKDRESGVVVNAVAALGALRAQAAREALAAVLGHDDPVVRKNAAEALARLGAPALHTLREVLRKAQSGSSGGNTANAPYIRLSVLTAYLEMVNHGADKAMMSHFLPLAVESLEDESWLVRAQAAQVVAQAALAIEREKQEREGRTAGR
jgi:hypothetical protein